MCGTPKPSEEGWICKLCTYDNPMTNDKCQICEAERKLTDDNREKVLEFQKSFSKPSSIFNSLSDIHSNEKQVRKLQETADYIYSKHPDGLDAFRTLLTICQKLYKRTDKYRTLWVQHDHVQKRILSYEGSLEFLQLLGFKLSHNQEKLECKLTDPEKPLLDGAVDILTAIIESLSPRDQHASLKSLSLEKMSSSKGQFNAGASSSVRPFPQIVLAEANSPDSLNRLGSMPSMFKSSESSLLESKEDIEIKSHKLPTPNSNLHKLQHITPGFHTSMQMLQDLDDGKAAEIDKWLEDDDTEVTDLQNLVFFLMKDKEDKGRDVLLLVHRTFSSSENLLIVLNQRFRDSNQNSNDIEGKNIRKNIMLYCYDWLHNYYEDFASQREFSELFEKFLKKVINENQCAKMAKRILRDFQTKRLNEEEMPESLLVVNMGKSCHLLGQFEHSVLGFKIEEIAEVLTLLDYEKFKKIKHRELLDQTWKKKDREKTAPNLLEMIAQYNRVCRWAQMAILKAKGIDQRQKIVTWFIKLSVHLIKIKNYNSSWAVHGALNSSCIFNLKQTWAGVRKRWKERFDDQTLLFSAKGNYRLLRKKIESLTPPAIPQLGVLLKDLVFIDDGFLLMKNETGSQVNFRKCIKLAERIRGGFGKFQEQPFEFERQDMILSWLTHQQDKVITIKEAALLDLADRVKASDNEDKHRRFFRMG